MEDQLTRKINKLHEEVTKLIAGHLSPVALKYHYSDVNLETKIKWKPFVLVLGNYSSGKSTLINDFVGYPVQNTGQAPTDDSFTVITGENSDNSSEHDHSPLYEKSGHSLFHDPKYPFEILRKHGETLASHFKLKVLPSEALKGLAIIDTPGMLDSTTEKDRGYDYQEVIGDLASAADVVLVLFDAHKAGTLKEAYKSLRDTLPEKVFEDRLVYVLNRIDECSSLEDLIRVYGTLCWNLSQITGRKDIPRILLTYSGESLRGEEASHEYLKHLKNQQEELRRTILEAPKRRLDHLVNFFENHSRYLKTLLTSLLEFTKRRRKFYLKYFLLGSISSLLLSFFTFYFLGLDLFNLENPWPYLAATFAGTLLFAKMKFVKKFFFPKFLEKQKAHLEELSKLYYQKDRDSWNKVKQFVELNLDQHEGALSLNNLKKELADIHSSYKTSRTTIRLKLDELDQISLTSSPSVKSFS